MRKTVTSRKSAVADWTARSSFFPKLADCAMAPKSTVSATGAAAKLRPARRRGRGLAEGAGAQDGRRGQPLDDEAHDDRDSEAQAEPQDGHLPSLLVFEGRKGAQRHDGADDGRGEHVGDRAGERQALFQKAPDDDHAAAFAHREDQSEPAADDDRDRLIFREQARDALGGDEDVDKSGDERAEQKKGDAFKENAEKRDGEVVEVERKPRHVEGESSPEAESWEKKCATVNGWPQGCKRAATLRRCGAIPGHLRGCGGRAGAADPNR